MTKLLAIWVVFGCVACTTSDGGTPPGPDAGSDGSGSVDAAPDAYISYAPCAGCCDPIHQTGCGSGQACYEVPLGHGTTTACMTPGTHGAYENCDQFATTANSCMAGMSCTGLCGKFCTSDADCKGAGRTGEDIPCSYFYPAGQPNSFGTCN